MKSSKQKVKPTKVLTKPKRVRKAPKKWTTVKSRHLTDKYHDPDAILAYSMFEVLTKYMETEANNNDWNYDKGHIYWQLDHLTFWFNHVYVPWNDGKYHKDIPFEGEFLVEQFNEDGQRHYKINREGNEEWWDNLDDHGVMDDVMKQKLIKNMKLLCELSPYLWS